MSRRRKVPKYSLHKASGQARVILDGKHVYIGSYNSPESQEAYARLIAEHFSPAIHDSPQPVPGDRYPDLSIDELLVRYLDFAQTYYVKNGEPTKELTCMMEAMGHLRAVYASDRAREFGPKKLKTVRQHMIDVCDLSRGVINNRINRIKRIFKWAVSEELVPRASTKG